MKKDIDNRYYRELEKLSQRDERFTFQKYYAIFDFDELYAQSTAYKIFKGERSIPTPAFRQFIDKTLEIVSLYTKDFSEVEPGDVNYALEEYNNMHHYKMTKQQIAVALNLAGASVLRAFITKTALTNTIYEILNYDLFSDKRNVTSFTNEFLFYEKMQERIMRAMIGDGINFRSLEEVSNLTNIPINNLLHPENLCRNRNDYFKAYDSLISNTPMYNTVTLKGRW